MVTDRRLTLAQAFPVDARNARTPPNPEESLASIPDSRFPIPTDEETSTGVALWLEPRPRSLEVCSSLSLLSRFVIRQIWGLVGKRAKRHVHVLSLRDDGGKLVSFSFRFVSPVGEGYSRVNVSFPLLLTRARRGIRRKPLFGKQRALFTD